MSADAAPALEVRDLVHAYAAPGGGRTEALRLPHLEVGRGERLAVEGESGSGKTTLLDLVAGIRPVQQGTVRVMGEAISGRGEAARDRLRALHVGYVFQSFNLLPHLTALENVALAMTFRPPGPESPHAAARRALARVGLEDRLRHRPPQLSVGQQQRVAIARALAGRPGLVLADEPTANLDAVRARACLDLLLDFAAECGAGVLLVTHDPEVAARFPRRLRLETPAAGAVA